MSNAFFIAQFINFTYATGLSIIKSKRRETVHNFAALYYIGHQILISANKCIKSFAIAHSDRQKAAAVYAKRYV